MSLENLLGIKTYKSLPSLVISKLEPMSETDQKLFAEIYPKKRKGKLISYLSWLFFSHYLYLGGLKSLPKQLLFWVTAGGVFIWWLWDALRMGTRVREANHEIAIEVLKDIRLLS